MQDHTDKVIDKGAERVFAPNDEADIRAMLDEIANEETTTAHEARLKQLHAKREYLRACRAYDYIRAKTYANRLQKHDKHYLANSETTTDSAVVKARAIMDEAELAFDQASIEVQRIENQLVQGGTNHERHRPFTVPLVRTN